MEHNSQQVLRPAGYSALIQRYNLQVIPNWHASYIGKGNIHRVDKTQEMVEETYPGRNWPGDGLGNHLEFALKYDGTNLVILANLFQVVDPSELVEYVNSKPNGKYARRIWFLYEYLTGNELPLADLQYRAYVDLLEPEEQYVADHPIKVRRQCVNNNLLGDGRFCPTVRRTELLINYESGDLSGRCRDVVSEYPPELMKRAMSYLYTKETKSSYAIERSTPSATRTERFIKLLRLAQREDYCSKARLIELQNQIVDPRYADTGYRTTQNYVGESSNLHEKVHYASPKPEDLPELMAGMLDAHRRMETGNVSTVVHAAVIGYGFVFMHPFEDGNGRIHRFLIHNILARRGFTPEGMVFPVSAAMLNNRSAYDSSLEAFSIHLMQLVEYEMDTEYQMTVTSDTAVWYRFIDMTAQAEALFWFLDQTIKKEFVEELDFLVNYVHTRQAIQEIVDMPDRRIDLFIKLCIQNGGTLSQRKKEKHFSELTEDEIMGVERAVREGFKLTGS